jgi:hypothetical protein
VRKKRVILLCLIGAALALIAFLALKPQPNEPSYDGHTLSHWVCILGTTGMDNPDQYQKATNAIDHIGAAALPFLVKWLQYEPPQWRTRLGYWLRGNPFPLAAHLYYPIKEPRAMQLAAGTHQPSKSSGKEPCQSSTICVGS